MSDPARHQEPREPPRPRPPRPPRGRVTLAEYLAFEERHPARHEYVGGYVYAMSGARLSHNGIVGNIFGTLWLAAKRTPCRVYVEAAKLRVGDDVYYPDVLVVCDPAGDDDLMAHAPCLVVEVLSPSTARIDRTQKLAAYQTLPSLRAYLIVSRRERHVLRYWRESAEAPWRVDEHAEGAVPVPCPAAGALPLDAIYEGVALGPRLRRVRERPAAAAGTPG